jgi:hypothetical protein
MHPSLLAATVRVGMEGIGEDLEGNGGGGYSILEAAVVVAFVENLLLVETP